MARVSAETEAVAGLPVLRVEGTLRDALAPEAESDDSTAVYGEANRLPSTEVTHDPQPDEHDDPGPDPHWSADRGPGGEPDVDGPEDRQ